MKYALLILMIFIFISCKSVDYPKIEESQAKIDKYNPLILSLDSSIRQKKMFAIPTKDLQLKINLSTLNKILQPLASNRTDDINLIFLSTKQFISENKSTLGINYTNFLNIDSGFVSLDLKSLKFDKLINNKLYANIEIEGKGNLRISGKYLGIGSNVLSNVQLYLNEPIIFDINTTNNGYVELKPLPKKLTLKTKFGVNLLGWSLPWYQEIPLELTDMVKPIRIPVSLKTDIQFPIPAQKFSENKLEFAPFQVDFTKSEFNGDANKIDYKTNLEFIRKK
jgi:hypothetical protein